jgi:hypothetical protein
MLARVCSAALNGIEAFPAEVEVNAGYRETVVQLLESLNRPTAIPGLVGILEDKNRCVGAFP